MHSEETKVRTTVGVLTFWALFAMLAFGVVGLLAAGCGGGVAVGTDADQAAKQRAIKEVEKYGGRFRVDESLPGAPVVDIELPTKKVTDPSLEAFGGLKQLHDLNLTSTYITDDGLKHLSGLTELRTLSLGDNNITAAGLKFLEPLTGLEQLSLADTRVTDDGIESLSHLTNLTRLYVKGTPITKAGVKKLQQALPHTRIIQ